jgi:predicted dehydrogenase
MSNSDSLAIGVVGAGSIARMRHLPNLAQIAGVRTVAVANRRVERAREAADEFAIGEVYEHWQEVVESALVDAVLVCTPPHLHAEVTLAALQQGKHVFCQARMANDLAEAERMLASDRATSLTTMLCPPPHYLTVDPYVRGILESGEELGEVRHVLVHHAGAMFADPAQPLHWRQRQDLNGINALDVGIVGEILNRWFGSVAEVAAIDRTWVGERPADADGRTAVESPDAVTVVGAFEQGATLTALFSGAVRGGQPRLVVHGSRGTLTCWPQSAAVELRRDGGDDGDPTEVPADERGTWTVEADFVEAVRQGRKGRPSFADGVRYMALTQAVLDAAASGERVAVRPV